MKLRRTMSALMAGVMAVSSAVVCSVSASAATDKECLSAAKDITTDATFSDGILHDFLNSWDNPLTVADYESITITYSVKDVGNITALQIYINGDKSKGGEWVSDGWSISAGDNQTITLNLTDTSKVKCTTFGEAGLKLYGPDGEACTGSVTVNSVLIKAKSTDDGSGDNQPSAKKDYFLDYNGKPITLTADGNGEATATFDITLDDITLGKSTVADLKAAYDKFGMKGIKYVKDSLELSASNFGACVFVKAGDNWEWWGALGYTTLSADGTDVILNTSEELKHWDGTVIPDDAKVQQVGVQIYVGDPKPDAVTELKKGDTIVINPTDTGDGDEDDTPATDGNVIWNGNTALGSWANTVSIKNPNLSAGDTVNIKYTVDDANAQLKVCAMTGSWDTLASMTDTNEYGVADLAKDGTYSFVISDADAKAVNESGMGIQGQNATITEVSVTKAQSGGDEEPDDKDYEESTTDYTALTDYTLIKLAGGQTLFVMPISKADATENDTAVLKITRASDGKYVRCVTWKVYKGFKFIDANNTKLMESGKTGTYFVLFLLNNVDESENYTFELLLGNAKG